MTDKTQEPVAWINWCAATGNRSVSFECESELASQPLYEGITQNTQYHYSKFHSWFDSELHRQKYTKDHPAYLAAQEAWNAANDAAQHRINRLNAEIEAWKVRFKIAEDALAKLNGPEQKPVQQQEPVSVPVTDNTYNYAKSLAEAIFKQHFASDEHYASGRIVWGVNDTVIGILTQIDNMLADMVRRPAQQEPVAYSYTSRITGAQGFSHHPMPRFIDSESWDIQPLYTSPPASKPWVRLSTDEIYDMYNEPRSDAEMVEFARAIEAKLREKNA